MTVLDEVELMHSFNARNMYCAPFLLLALCAVLAGCTKTTGTANTGPQESKEESTGPENPSMDPTLEAALDPCGSCHEEQTRFLAYGGHSSVSCRECHGVEGDHIKSGNKPHSRGNKQCFECHSLVEGDAEEQMTEEEVFEHHLKFLEKKHVVKVKREKVKKRCVHCHDPHLGQ